MSDHFDSGALPENSVAWLLTHYSYADMVTWAPAAAAARYNWVKLYRDAYGNNGSWPSVKASRLPELDRSHLPHGFKRRVIERHEATIV